MEEGREGRNGGGTSVVFCVEVGVHDRFCYLTILRSIGEGIAEALDFLTSSAR